MPAQRPNLSAYAGRFMRSIKGEARNRVVPVGDGHLRTVVRESITHYHEERNHQGIGNRVIEQRGKVVALAGCASRRE